MSVAFRRENDDEHLEPTFELPIPPGPNLVTARGLALIEAKAAESETVLEAAEGDEARKKALRDARYWRQRMGSAEVAPAPKGDVVAFGTRVTIKRDGETRTVDLVGHDESAPAEGRIAFTAPLARALMGAEEGDDVDFAGSDEPFQVVAIEPIPKDGTG